MDKIQRIPLFLGVVLFSVSISCFYNYIKQKRLDETLSKELIAKSTPVKLANFKAVPNTKSELKFFENKGQVSIKNHEVKYVLEGQGTKFFLKPDGILYSFIKKEKTLESDNASKEFQEDEFSYQVSSFNLSWVGINKNVRIKPEDQALEVRNYYNKSIQGITNVKSFRKLTYENIYDKIDLVFYIKDDGLKYDFVVKPGGNPNDIMLRYSGNENLELNANGELIISGKFGEIKEGKPFSFQKKAHLEKSISSKYILENGIIKFDIGEYNNQKDLVIDPTLLWSTYFGGTKDDEGMAVSTDPEGNVYLAGKTSSDYNIAYEGHEPNQRGEWDAFLVKFDASGNRLWATYYGGDRRDSGLAVCTDKFGYVYLAGYTESHTHIAHNGHDNTYNEFEDPSGTRFDRDAFLVKFHGDGTRVWGTYYGGEDFAGGAAKSEQANGVATDGVGNVFITGFTTSNTGIAFNGYDNTISNYSDAFLVKFNAVGVRKWATYFGAEGEDEAKAICVDPWDNIYITGFTTSQIFTGLTGHQNFLAGDKDAFLAKFSNDGDFYWNTFYGGSDYDEAFSVDTDASGHVYIAGATRSNNNISQDGHDDSFNKNTDAFIAKFTFWGLRKWGTYYGGVGSDFNARITVSKNDDIYLAGMTSSETGIATNGGYQDAKSGLSDAYLVRFNKDGKRQWGTYFGGTHIDYLEGLTTDISANVYIAGYTYSDNGIFHNGYQDTNGGLKDAFLAKFKPYGSGGPDGPGDVTDKDDPTHDDPNDVGRTKGNRRTSAQNTDAKLSLYPNPSNVQINIFMDYAPDMKTSFEIFDLKGSKVFGKEVVGPIEESIQVSTWQKGMYILKLQNLQGEFSEKFIIK